MRLLAEETSPLAMPAVTKHNQQHDQVYRVGIHAAHDVQVVAGPHGAVLPVGGHGHSYSIGHSIRKSELESRVELIFGFGS